MICSNLAINSKGELLFNNKSAVELINKYGSPLYVLDEDRIRHNCRIYVENMKKYFGEGSYPLFASKSNSFKKIYSIINEENMGTDVVSVGELYTCLSVNFPMEKVFFHGNNKTDEDIEFAISNGVGYFVADNIEEVEAIDKIAKKYNKIQKILIRITPGIDPHTYEAISTGKVDSKFGNAIQTGLAQKITELALSKKNIDLVGFHFHVGSQVFDSSVYISSSMVLLEFIKDVKEKLGYITKILNIGGGYGVRYVETDPFIDIPKNIEEVASFIKHTCKILNIEMPKILMEPGRSIVADAGLTLYTCGTVKKIEGFKNYVSIDGGMADNPRYALYKSSYTVVNASKMNEKLDFKCSLVGRCCESGDIIQENVTLPSSTMRGDIIGVLTTGAYNYSMSSNYNRLLKPPIIMVNKQEDYVAVKRETLKDIIRNDM